MNKGKIDLWLWEGIVTNQRMQSFGRFIGITKFIDVQSLILEILPWQLNEVMSSIHKLIGFL